MRLTTGRAVTLGVGLPVMLAAAGWGGFTATGWMAQTSEHHEASYDWHGGPITLSSTAGSIHLVTGDGRQVVVAYTERYQLKTPTVTGAETPDGGVALRAKCPGGIFSSNCAINYTVTVPPGARVDLRTGDGSIEVADEAAGTTGLAVMAHTGDGHINVLNARGPLDLSTGDGGITGAGLGSASVKAHTGDGGISLGFAVAATAVDASSGDGSIHITVPTDTGPYRVDASSGDGVTHVRVPTDPQSPRRITAHTGDGSVTVDSMTVTHG